MANGWIKLHRELIDKPIWKCSLPEQKAILITLLCLANHEEKEWIWQGKKYICQPGQFITSLKSIAEASGTSMQNVRTALKNFENIYEFLTSQSTNKNRLITIVNWALYQSKDEELTNTLTSGQQAPNKRLTTNKNDKNDKNEKNIKTYRQIIQDFTENEKLIKALEDYLQMRKVKRKPATTKALELVLKTLEPFPDDIRIAMLENSIKNSWTDVYEIRENQPPAGQARKPIQTTNHQGRADIDYESLYTDVTKFKREVGHEIIP